MDLATVLLLINAILLFVLLRIVLSVRKFFRKGEDMTRLGKSLILTLGGLLGARLARHLLKKVL